MSQDPEPESVGVEPQELLRALLMISPEDAAEVREEATEKAGVDQKKTQPLR